MTSSALSAHRRTSEKYIKLNTALSMICVLLLGAVTWFTKEKYSDITARLSALESARAELSIEQVKDKSDENNHWDSTEKSLNKIDSTLSIINARIDNIHDRR